MTYLIIFFIIGLSRPFKKYPPVRKLNLKLSKYKKLVLKKINSILMLTKRFKINKTKKSV